LWGKEIAVMQSNFMRFGTLSNIGLFADKLTDMDISKVYDNGGLL
jgi:hypothetical protein